MQSTERKNIPIQPDTDNAMTTERLRAALVVAAYIVMRHGDLYAPILERLEREYEEIAARERPLDRARRILEAYTVEGGRKAILSSQSRF